MPFPCIALGAGAGVGLLRCLRPGSENPVAVIVPELVMPNHPEDYFVFSSSPPAVSLSLSRSHLFTTHCILLLVCQSSCVHVVPINPQDLLLGRPMFHTQTHAQTRARTTVFPPSRICSIFPQESGGTRPISLILPVSSCLALKMCV